jgi:hypothetical protein
MEWCLPNAPYLVEKATIGPDVTGSGVLSVMHSLRGCPLDWNFATMGYVVFFIRKVS